MLSLVFFILAVATAATGIFLLSPGVQQMGAWGAALLFLALSAVSMVRKTNKPWR